MVELHGVLTKDSLRCDTVLTGEMELEDHWDPTGSCASLE